MVFTAGKQNGENLQVSLSWHEFCFALLLGLLPIYIYEEVLPGGKALRLRIEDIS
jgi:hypothetical protein